MMISSSPASFKVTVVELKSSLFLLLHGLKSVRRRKTFNFEPQEVLWTSEVEKIIITLLKLQDVADKTSEKKVPSGSFSLSSQCCDAQVRFRQNKQTPGQR